jgi:outer membrane protein assembly factor BamA
LCPPGIQVTLRQLLAAIPPFKETSVAMNRSRPCCLFAVLVLGACLGAALPGYAASHEGWLVSEVKVSGMPPGLDGDITRGLGLKSSTGFGRSGKVRFRQELLQQDRQRLRLYLARGGYPYARIEPRLTPDKQPFQVKVHFRITPGPAVQVGRLELLGVPEGMQGLEAKARKDLPAGSRLADARVKAVAGHILLELQAGGYARARVRTAVSRPDSFTADLVFNFEAGQPYRFAAIQVSPIPADLDPLVRRSLGISRGDRFSPDLLTTARQNLRDLQLFRQIKVSADSIAPGELALAVHLKLAAMRTARVSVGSWSDDPIRLRAQWRHRNIFARGRGWKAVGRILPAGRRWPPVPGGRLSWRPAR